MALGQVAEGAADQARVLLRPGLAVVGQAARRPQPLQPRLAMRALHHPGLARQTLQHGQVDGVVGGADQARRYRPLLQAGDQPRQRGEVQPCVPPHQALQRGEVMAFDAFDFLGRETRHALVAQLHGAEAAVALVPPGAAADLRQFGRGQPPELAAVELGQRREGDVGDVHVKAHADRVGRDQIVDLTRLIHLDLRIARPRGERAHDNRGPALVTAQHLGQRVDVLGGERDDGGALGQPAQFLRTRIGERRESRAGDDLGVRRQAADQRAQGLGTEDHGLVAAAHVQQPVGEHMPALAVRAHLRLVQRDKADIAVGRHRLGGAEKIARSGRADLLFAGDERDLRCALLLDDAVINLARKQTQREADHAG